MSDTHQHGGCGGGCGGCGSKSQMPQELAPLKPHPLSQIKTVIAVTGGKGGTGKSLVTGLLAAELAKSGKQVGIFDADILAPAIPQMFDLPQGVTRGEAGLYPAISDRGVKVLSVHSLLEHETDVVTWNSAGAAGIVQQLWSDVVWDQLDVLLIDLPPGTGDVSLVIFERLPLDGLLVVSTPQALVNQVVERTVRLALEKEVPLFGLIENFSDHFGGDAAAELAARYSVPITDRLAFDPALTDAADEGRLESLGSVYLPGTAARMQEV
ncbi:MAG: Mrp/NBP35 family ATP-binding protein [Oscillospiraceae bacterium]|nr:Mrp/NBP35 family ATP-binding protein [Oscillospiraceae bacterium]